MTPAVFPRSDFACESTTQKCAARAPKCRQNRSQNGCQTRTKPSGGVLEPTFRENIAMSNPSMPAYVCSTSARWQNQRPCCPKINICENAVLNACPENNVQVYQKSYPNDDQKGSRRRPKTEKNQYRTVLLVSGRSLVRVLPQLQRSWNLTGCCGRYERQTRSRRHGKLSTASKNSHLGGSTFGASSGRACTHSHLAFC